MKNYDWLSALTLCFCTKYKLIVYNINLNRKEGRVSIHTNYSRKDGGVNESDEIIGSSRMTQHKNMIRNQIVGCLNIHISSTLTLVDPNWDV